MKKSNIVAAVAVFGAMLMSQAAFAGDVAVKTSPAPAPAVTAKPGPAPAAMPQMPFAERKAKMLESMNIQKPIQAEFETCLKAANSDADFKKCQDTAQAKVQEAFKKLNPAAFAAPAPAPATQPAKK